MKKIYAILSLIFIVTLSYAQTLSIKGSVRDSKGEGVIGAVVMVKGATGSGAVTDTNGQYSIQAPAGAVLVASCIGFRSSEKAVENGKSCDFVLSEDHELLDEVVVVGYGAMRRSDITGSVTSVRIDEDIASKSATFDQLLDGHAAGVQVLSDNSNPDAGVSIRVRGLSTFSGHSDPLYVVDGVIINAETSTASVFASAVGDVAARESESTNALAGINPQDIASIEVLKDASATAIYGSQGANGVVLITTKEPMKDKPVINFSAGLSIGQVGKRLDVLSFDEYVDMVAKYNTSGTYKKILYEDFDNRQGLKVKPTDWQDYSYRNSVSHRYYFSIGGRPMGWNYNFSLGFNRNEGIIKCTDSNSLTARLSLSKEIFKRFKLSFKTGFGYTKSNLINGANDKSTVQNYSSIISSILYTKPFRYCSPDQEEEEAEEALEDANTRYGPERSMQGSRNTSERFRITPSIKADWKILNWLSFQSTFGADLGFSQSKKAKDNIMSLGHGNIAGVSETFAVAYNWDNLLQFNWKGGSHNVSGTLGQSLSRKIRSYQAVSAEGLPQKYAYGADINEALTSNSYYNAYGEENSSILSFFGRGIYNYSERYILTATIRFDGSSKFLGKNKWGIFPSAAFAWRLTSEPWFYVPCISNAKLRLGWGQVGNQNIGSYLTGTVYTTVFNAAHNDAGKLLGIYSSNIANADLKWETTTQENVGLDMGFYGGRLAFSVDAYNKDTRDLLQSKNIAYSTGFTKMSVNDGSIKNYGVELNIDSVPVKTADVEWSLGANLSVNRNIITNVGEMGDNAMIFVDKNSAAVKKNFFYGDGIFNSLCAAPVNIFIEGEPMGLYYGYVTDGIVQKGEKVIGFSEGVYREEGTLKYRDLNQNGIWDSADRAVIGNPHPKFTYGFNTALSFKRFTLKVDFSGAYKFDIANMNNIRGYLTDLSRNTRRDAALCAWTEENPSNVWPKFGAAADEIFSDRYIEDGSYLKISNVSLSYALRFKKKSKVLHGMNFSLSVGNPFIWSNYSGYNPTTNSFGRNVMRMGVDLNSSPYVRSYNFDVKFSF